MFNNGNLSAVIPQGIIPRGKRNHRGEIIPDRVELNDDCMREIMNFLNWNDFLNLCEEKPHISKFHMTMTNKTFYMGQGIINNIHAVNYVHQMKSIEVDYTVPENDLRNLMNFMRMASAVEKLVIRNPPEPLYHVTSKNIKKLTMETSTQQQEWEPIDHLEPIIKQSHQIQELICVNGLLGQQSITHLVHNPISKLTLIDTMMGDSLDFLTYLYLAIDLRHLEILGSLTYNLQSTFFQFQHPCKERLTNLVVELLPGLEPNTYNDLINFTELTQIKIYYRDPHLLERTLTTLTHSNEKLKMIYICENMSAENPLLLTRLKQLDELNFINFKLIFARRKITLTRQAYTFDL